MRASLMSASLDKLSRVLLCTTLSTVGNLTLIFALRKKNLSILFFASEPIGRHSPKLQRADEHRVGGVATSQDR